MMHTNKTRQSSAGNADQIITTKATSIQHHRHIEAHIAKQKSNNKLQSDEIKAKQKVQLCLQHVRQQRQIA